MVKILKGEQSLRGAAAVVGVGLSRFGDLSGNSHMEIMGEAVHHALADAGLTIRDVDGIFATNFVDQLAPLAAAGDHGHGRCQWPPAAGLAPGREPRPPGGALLRPSWLGKAG